MSLTLQIGDAWDDINDENPVLGFMLTPIVTFLFIPAIIIDVANDEESLWGRKKQQQQQLMNLYYRMPFDVQKLIMDLITDRRTFNNARLVNKRWAMYLRKSPFYNAQRVEMFVKKNDFSHGNASLSLDAGGTAVLELCHGHLGIVGGVSLGIITSRKILERGLMHTKELITVAVPNGLSFETVLTSHIQEDYDVVIAISAKVPMHNQLVDHLGSYDLNIENNVLEARQLSYIPSAWEMGLTVAVTSVIGLFRLCKINKSSIPNDEKKKMTKKIIKETGCNIVGSIAGAALATGLLLLAAPAAGPLMILVIGSSGRIAGSIALNLAVQ